MTGGGGGPDWNGAGVRKQEGRGQASLYASGRTLDLTRRDTGGHPYEVRDHMTPQAHPVALPSLCLQVSYQHQAPRQLQP